MSDVTVTQEDAKARRDYLYCVYQDTLEEAFARHRTTALAAKEAELAAERAKVEKLREALEVFVECARYSPHMGGGRSFMGWSQSALRRAESHARATLAETQPERTQP